MKIRVSTGVLLPLEDICQCLKTILVVRMREGVFYRHLWVEARGAAKHLIVYVR